MRSGLIDFLLVTCNPVLPASGLSCQRLNRHPHHLSQRRLWGVWLDTQMEVGTRSVTGCRFWRVSGSHLATITVALQLPFFGNGFRSKPRERRHNNIVWWICTYLYSVMDLPPLLTGTGPSCFLSTSHPPLVTFTVYLCASILERHTFREYIKWFKCQNCSVYSILV